jgi:hypothetical protein
MEQPRNTASGKRLTRLIIFVGTVIIASTAVMFVTFLDSTPLLMIILLPSIITLSISIVPTPLSSKKLIIYGVISGLISLIAIIYAWSVKPEMVKEYLGF